MPDFAVHRLGPADLVGMRGLNAMFASAFEAPEHYQAAPPPDDYLREMLGRDHVIVLVANEGDIVIGGLVAYELDKLEQARREIYIYDLAVEADHRRRGVATGLISRLKEIAAERGAYVIYVQADYGDDPAVALYEGLGVREDVMHFDIPVPPRG